VEKLSLGMRDTRSRQQFINAALRFQEVVGRKPTYDRTDLLTFIRHMEEKKYSPNYQRFMFYALKRAFEECELDWPLKPGKYLPEVIEDQLVRPILTRDQILALIGKARQACDARELAMLALSSTYGLRRAELAQLTQQEVDLEAGTVRIQTRKKGRWRLHQIPLVIQPYIQGYDFGEGLSTDPLTRMYREICAKVGLPRDPRAGWHSIRRALDTELLYKTTPPQQYMGTWALIVYDFLRWRYRAAKEFGMHTVYGRIEPQDVDTAIFSVHPFLPAWGG